MNEPEDGSFVLVNENQVWRRRDSITPTGDERHWYPVDDGPWRNEISWEQLSETATSIYLMIFTDLIKPPVTLAATNK
jgi:hypothetical protein